MSRGVLTPLSCFGGASIYVHNLLTSDTCPGFQVWKDRIAQEAQAWVELLGSIYLSP